MMTALTTTWQAIENKDDYYFEEGLKHPFTSKVSRTGLQLSRRKTSIAELRQSLNMKNLSYSGLFFIGIADDTLYSDTVVFSTLAR